MTKLALDRFPHVLAALASRQSLRHTLFAAALMLGGAAQAQRPLLQINVQPGDQIGGPVKGGYNVSITNAANVAVTAYDIEIKSHDSQGVAGRETRWINGVPGNWQLAAGATETLHRGGTPETLAPNVDPSRVVVYFASIDSVTNIAVLYADGSSAGDPQAVGIFVLERKTMLGDIKQAIRLLSVPAAQGLTSVSDLSPLASQLDAIAAQGEAVLNQADVTNLRHGFRDSTCRAAARSLLETKTHSRISTILSYLQRQESELEASVPALQ